MRVLLDESFPVELASDLPDHEVVHVNNLGWKGISNGELLRRADEARFDTLRTGDSHLPDQQNLAAFDVAIVQLRPRLVMDQVRTMNPAIEQSFRSAKPGAVTIIRPDID